MSKHLNENFTSYTYLVSNLVSIIAFFEGVCPDWSDYNSCTYIVANLVSVITFLKVYVLIGLTIILVPILWLT